MTSGTTRLFIRFFERFTLLPFFLVAICTAGCRPVIALGKNPSGKELEKIEALPNYKDGQFQNLEQTSSAITRKKVKWTGIVKNLLNKPKTAKPGKPIPYMVTDLTNARFQKPTVIWLGHSSFLLKTKTANILVDPSFSGFAGPFRGLIKAFEGANEYGIKDLPPIDVLVISHDHYDHLDYTTVMQLKHRVKKVIVPIGVGSHLRRWGFDPEQVTELNWHQSVQISDSLRITSTPAHHRSNRGFAQRKTLWSSYVFNANGYTIYFSGDSGYSKHFKLIGEQYGPFDLALVECGQYNIKWPQSHLFPFQSARAGIDLKARMMIPIHWAKFAESTHPWNEPVQLLLKSADSLNLPVSVPYIGQPYSIGDPLLRENWWNVGQN